MPDPVELRYRYKDEVEPLNRTRHVLWGGEDVFVFRGKDDPAQRTSLRELAGRLDRGDGQNLVRDHLALPEQGVLVVRLADATPLVFQALIAFAHLPAAPAAVTPGLTDKEQPRYLLYSTGEIVVRFLRAQKAPDWLLEGGRWTVTRPSLGDYAPEALVLRPAADQAVDDVFAKAWSTQERADVACAYPVLLRRLSPTMPVDVPPPWHLGGLGVRSGLDTSAHVRSAWKLSTGRGAVIGLVEQYATDVLHEALRGQIFGDPIDVSAGPEGTVQVPPTAAQYHATIMAGFAVARSDCPAPGVAPGAQVLAVRRGSGIGALAEADAIVHASRNADLVSCAWGPRLAGGVAVPVPPHSRWAITWAERRGGRRGRGTCVLFAAGNQGAEAVPQSMDANGYASCPGVLAIGASDRAGSKLPMSCEGDALACVFPSSAVLPDLLPAVQPGNSYVGLPGGTSSACACMAGVLALVLARAPELTPREIATLVSATCDPAPPGRGRVRGRDTGHGRVNAEALLLAALAGRP